MELERHRAAGAARAREGAAHIKDLGTLSDVSCRGAATRCRAALLSGRRAGAGRPGRGQADAPSRPARARWAAHAQALRAARRARAAASACSSSCALPAPQLWSPDAPRLYSAKFTLRDRERVIQVEKRRIGLRSVEVKGGRSLPQQPPHPAARRVHPRGHARLGAALTSADMNRIVADLKMLGANITRAHYLLNERLLSRLDRAGIMVWSQAPIWQRDAGAHLLWQRQGACARARDRSPHRDRRALAPPPC